MLILTSGPEFGLAHRLTFALMLIMFLAISLIGLTSRVMAADFDKGKAVLGRLELSDRQYVI